MAHIEHTYRHTQGSYRTPQSNTEHTPDRWERSTRSSVPAWGPAWQPWGRRCAPRLDHCPSGAAAAALMHQQPREGRVSRMRPQHRPQPGRRAPGVPGAAANVSSCSRSNAVVRRAAGPGRAVAMQEPEFSTYAPSLSPSSPAGRRGTGRAAAPGRGLRRGLRNADGAGGCRGGSSVA